MSTSSELLTSVDWYYPEFADKIIVEADLDFYGVEKSLGFLAIAGEGTDINLIGFAGHAPGTSSGEPFFSVTELADVPKTQCSIDYQGKGVGKRLYNTPEAVAGTREAPQQIDAVLFSFDMSEMLDLRTPQNAQRTDKIIRIFRHAGRIARSFGSETRLAKVVNGIHAGFGDASVVFQPQPPRGEMRRTLRRVESDQILRSEAFALIRDPNLPLCVVGKVRQ